MSTSSLSQQPQDSPPYSLLFDGPEYLVIMKNRGLLCAHKNSNPEKEQFTLGDYLYRDLGIEYQGMVQRLDRPVSGVMLWAKNKMAHQHLTMLFQKGKMEKKYWAISCALLPQEKGRLEHFLEHHQKSNKTWAFDQEGAGRKKSALQYQLLSSGERYFLYEITLETGRTHQIRCQFAKAGAVIRGDLKYGAKRSLAAGGIDLHSRFLGFIDPWKKEKVEFSAPVPEDKLWLALTKDLA